MAHCWKCTDHGQKKKSPIGLNIGHQITQKYRTVNSLLKEDL